MADSRILANFVAIVEAGSVSRAAERIGLTQSALSQQLAGLEANYGVLLVHRTPRGVVPTAHGILLNDRARLILSQIEAMRGDIGSLGAAAKGTVSVAMPVSVTQMLALPLYDRLHRDHPAVRLRITGAPNRAITSMLHARSCDLAIAFAPVDDARLIVDSLAREQMFFLCAPERAPAFPMVVGVADIDPMRLALPCRPHSIRMLLDDALATSVGDRAVEIDDPGTQLSLVTRGTHDSVMPWPLIREAVVAGLVVARPVTEVGRDLVMLRNADAPLSIAGAIVHDLIVLLVAERVRSGEWRGLTLPSHRPC